MNDPDKQILNAAGGLGCSALTMGLVVIPPLFLPAYILYRVAVTSGATNLHPAIVIALTAATIWGLFKLSRFALRSIPPRFAQLLLASYIGASYTFVFFQHSLTGSQAKLDIAWLLLGFAIFFFIGWKVGGVVVARASKTG